MRYEFITYEVSARASSGRIAFGSVLAAGAVVAAVLACTAPALMAAEKTFMLVWLAALLAGAVARVADRSAGPARWRVGHVALAIGVALIGPLSLHALAIRLNTGEAMTHEWVVLSVFATSFAHLVLAATYGRRVWCLTERRPAMSKAAIYAFTVLASCVPGLVLYAIPPLLVAVTGLPWVLLTVAHERLIARERDMNVLPVARLR